jgi:hypothetical protein
MRVIDLIPPDIQARRDSDNRVRAWGRRLALFAISGAIVLGGLFWFVKARNSELVSLAHKHGGLQESLQRAGSLLEERRRLARTHKAISLINTDRTAGWLLGILESTMTPDTYLESVVVERCPPQDPEVEIPEGDPCVGSMKVKGIAPGHKEVGHLIQELITLEAFSDVALISSRDSTQPGHGNQVEFEIFCMLQGEGAIPEAQGYGTLQAERLYE